MCGEKEERRRKLAIPISLLLRHQQENNRDFHRQCYEVVIRILTVSSCITTYIVIPYENVSDVTSAATIWFSRSNLLKLFLDNVHCTFRATLDTSLSSPPLRPLQISQQCIFMLFYTYKKLGLAYVGFLFLLHSQ